MLGGFLWWWIRGWEDVLLTGWLGVFGAVWGCEFEGGGHGFLGAMC